VAHGVRTADTIARIAPWLDVAGEAALLDATEAEDTDGLVAIAGAAELLAGLAPGSWGIVTSGHRVLATRRLRALGLPVPAALVCGDEIERGKPDPEGYLAGARLLAVEPGACVVVEDVPAGIAAAQAAGMRAVAITTTYPAATLHEADVVIDTLRELPGAIARLS
jgi:sugar-phosphatase